MYGLCCPLPVKLQTPHSPFLPVPSTSTALASTIDHRMAPRPFHVIPCFSPHRLCQSCASTLVPPALAPLRHPSASPTALAAPCPLPLLPSLRPPCPSLLAALPSPLSPLPPLSLSCSLYHTVFFACPVCRAPIRLVIRLLIRCCELKVPVPFQGPERTPGGEEQAAASLSPYL